MEKGKVDQAHPAEAYAVAVGESVETGDLDIVISFTVYGIESPRINLTLEQAKRMLCSLRACINFIETPRN